LLLIPSGHHAAIHVPDRSGDSARRVAQQEINDRTHVRRSAHATNRVKGVESRQRLADLFRLDESVSSFWFCWLFLFSGSCRRPLKMLYVVTCLLLA
jgi:hypothetical protein